MRAISADPTHGTYPAPKSRLASTVAHPAGNHSPNPPSVRPGNAARFSIAAIRLELLPSERQSPLSAAHGERTGLKGLEADEPQGVLAVVTPFCCRE